MRTNTYQAADNRVTIDADRAAAFSQLAAYYADVFASGRSEYAMPALGCLQGEGVKGIIRAGGVPVKFEVSQNTVSRGSAAS
jgi:nitric oxide reductase large subunit